MRYESECIIINIIFTKACKAWKQTCYNTIWLFHLWKNCKKIPHRLFHDGCLNCTFFCFQCCKTVSTMYDITGFKLVNISLSWHSYLLLWRKCIKKLSPPKFLKIRWFFRDSESTNLNAEYSHYIFRYSSYVVLILWMVNFNMYILKF